MKEIVFPTIPDLEQMCEYAVKIFNIDVNDDMAKPTVENCLRTIALDKYSYICLKDAGTCIAWSCAIPTSLKNMDSFLAENMTERELIDDARNNPSFEALYLIVTVVLPEYRRKGLGLFLERIQIEYFKEKYNITNFYSWWFSEEGKKLGLALQRELNIEIKAIGKI